MITRRSGILSKHFHLQELAEHAYAAVHRKGGLAVGNAGLVDLGDRLICFDAFLSPLAAADLNLIAESMFDKSIDSLIFSHYHSDHTWGSQAFSHEIDVIASSQVRNLIETAGHDEIRYYRENSDQLQTALQSSRSSASTPDNRQNAQLWEDFLKATLDSTARARVRQATLTFSDELHLHGTRERARLFQLCGGHTAYDTLMYLPSSGVLFTGDLVTIQCHPYLAESMPGGYLAALEEIRKISPRLIVPGHGPVGTLDDVRMMLDYHKELQRVADRIHASGKNLDLAKPVDIPKKFSGWDFENYFQDNLRFMIKSLG